VYAWMSSRWRWKRSARLGEVVSSSSTSPPLRLRVAIGVCVRGASVRGAVEVAGLVSHVRRAFAPLCSAIDTAPCRTRHAGQVREPRCSTELRPAVTLLQGRPWYRFTTSHTYVLVR
jgi:hypothetical protein